MRNYLDATYALLVEDGDTFKIDRALDEPLEREMTADEIRRRDIARIAEKNRAGMAALDRTAK